MFDLGILPGTRIENVMPSPLGDPIAYRVRSAVVALRLQADLFELFGQVGGGFAFFLGAGAPAFQLIGSQVADVLPQVFFVKILGKQGVC